MKKVFTIIDDETRKAVHEALEKLHLQMIIDSTEIRTLTEYERQLIREAIFGNSNRHQTDENK